MGTGFHVQASYSRESSRPSPPCAHCESSRTEPVVTMRLETVDADRWYRCEDCERVFSAGDDR